MSLWQRIGSLGLLSLAFFASHTHAFDYNISSAGSVFLTDEKTSIVGLKTIFTGDVTLVTATDIEWEFTGMEGGDDFVRWTTIVDGQVQDEGIFNLTEVERELPSAIDCGSITVSKSK